MGPAWLHLALLEQGELFAQEEVLGSQCAARPRSEHDQMDEIARDGGQGGEAVCQRSKDGARHERSASNVTRRYASANWRLDEISADHRHNDPLFRLRSRQRCIPSPRALLLGNSTVVSVRDCRIVRGVWQSIILAELDGPRTRSVSMEIFGA
jgi:hypothetical protein